MLGISNTNIFEILMESGDGVAEVDRLERGLLTGGGSDSEPAADDDHIDDGGEEDPALFTASFRQAEEDFMKYQTARWVLYSLLLILAWGIGLFMLIYLPVRRYILRKDIRSRKLYVTPNAVVYKVISLPPLSLFPFGYIVQFGATLMLISVLLYRI